MQRYALRDDQWTKIKDFLPGREGHVGGTAADNRLFVDALLYRYRTGQCWRPLLRALGLINFELDGETKEQIEKPRYTFHCLRHTAASLFIEQGWTPKKLMTVMGHSSIQMTFDLYGHLWRTLEDDAKAVAQIQARLLG